MLAESPENLVLLAVTVLLSVTTFTARRATAVHGATHLAGFVAWVTLLFA